MKKMAVLLAIALATPATSGATMHPDVGTFAKNRVDCVDQTLDAKVTYATKGAGDTEEGIIIWEETSTGIQLIRHWRVPRLQPEDNYFLLVRGTAYRSNGKEYQDMIDRFGLPDKGRLLEKFISACHRKIDAIENMSSP